MTTAKDLLTKEYVKVKLNDSLSSFLGALKNAKEQYALVFDGKKYVGTITKRVLLSQRLNTNQMKVSNIIKKRSRAKGSVHLPILEPETDVKTICKLMAAANTHLLPVTQDGKIIGVVKAKDAIKEMAPNLRTSCEKISKKPITTTANTKTSTVFDILTKNHIDHLPIVDGRNNLIGMVSVTDLIEKAQLFSEKRQHGSREGDRSKRAGSGGKEKTHPYDLPIENYMGSRLLCCAPPGTQLKDAITMMTRNGVGSIVLVENNKPTGILTYKDLLTYAGKQ